MPGYTCSAPDLRQRGPVISVSVAVPSAAETAMTSAGHPVPSPVTVPALIDTGATMSAVSRDAVRQLGLQPVGSVLIATPAVPSVRMPAYAVRSLLPGAEIETTAVEGLLGSHDARAIIGRDVLAHGVLVYVGWAGQCTISF